MHDLLNLTHWLHIILHNSFAFCFQQLRHAVMLQNLAVKRWWLQFWKNCMHQHWKHLEKGSHRRGGVPAAGMLPGWCTAIPWTGEPAQWASRVHFNHIQCGNSLPDWWVLSQFELWTIYGFNTIFCLHTHGLSEFLKCFHKYDYTHIFYKEGNQGSEIKISYPNWQGW